MVSSTDTPPGSAFEFDPATGAIVVPEGAQLVWVEFPAPVGWKRLRNRAPGSVGGEWLVWCEYDEEYDAALLVRAELRSHCEATGEMKLTPGYVLVPRRWWLPFGRKERLWDRMPEGNSPARGWLISERLMREIEDGRVRP